MRKEGNTADGVVLDEFGESTETLAKGLYDILSASVPAEHALSVLASAAKAAQAGITDTGTAADAITTVLNAYGLATDAFYGAVGLLAEAWAGLQAIWVETTTFLANTWTRFTGGLTKAWNSAENLLTKGWLKLMGLFDEDLDVQAAIRMADEDLARRNAQIEREAHRTLAEREQQRKQKREAIEQERIGTLRAIDEMADAENEARKQRYADQLKASEDALAKARSEWQAAIAEAGAQRAEAEEGEGPEKPENVAERIKKMLAGVTDAIGQADVVTRGMTTAGTFNALVAAGLGTGNVAERTAKATEETARNTAKIARKAGLQPSFT